MVKLESRGISVFVALVFFAVLSAPLPARGMEAAQRVCPPPLEESGTLGVSALTPLQPGERLLYDLAELTGGTLEVRYRVNGNLHLTEIIDLAKMQLPERATAAPEAPSRLGDFSRKQNDARVELAQRREGAAERRVIELLTLDADSTRELHRLAREGKRIEIDILHDGRVRESVSLAEVISRAAALRRQPLAPVFAPSAVTGPGVVMSPRTLRVATNEYLESCSDCTSSHPCDTECGYDPGKGGPTTCGEYGAPCEPWCPPSYTSGEWWGPWTYYSSGYGVGRCLNTWIGYRWHNEWITTYRRERIRRTTTCPNSPSCNGCYDTEAVISVQYANYYCYQETGGGCFNGQTPCCSTCSVYGWSACTYSFPCF